jgi:hypothetical protein
MARLADDVVGLTLSSHPAWAGKGFSLIVKRIFNIERV